MKDDGYGVMSVLESLKSGGVEEGEGSEWRQFQNLGEDSDGFSLGVSHCMILSGGIPLIRSIDAEAWNSCEILAPSTKCTENKIIKNKLV